MNQRMLGHYCVIVGLLLASASCGKLLPGGKPPAGTAATTPAPELPKPVLVTLTLQASPTINPSESSRPSPVVVRVYQLRSETRFRSVAYDKLYEEDKSLLAGDLVDNPTNLTLRPGDQTPISLLLGPEVRFVGVAAFFRQYGNEQWKLVIPTPIKGDGTVLIDKSVTFTAK